MKNFTFEFTFGPSNNQIEHAMEQSKVTLKENGGETEGTGFRRSRRVNKGVPPRRLAEIRDAELGLNAVPIGNANTSRIKKNCKSVAGKIISAESMENMTVARKDERNTRSDIIHPCFKPLLRDSTKKGESVISGKSSISKLNLELKLIQQKKELDEQETQEKLRAIERKRENVLKEM